MVKRIGTSRTKSRHKLSKKPGQKGKISLTRYFQAFKTGDRVVLKAEPAVHKGIYHTRFHGKAGIVTEKQGSCYMVAIKDIHKKKLLLVHPVHLKKVLK